jgi:hypothetical protein
MERKLTQTDQKYEQDKGRVALWLAPDDIRWLSRHCCCPDGAPKEATDRCVRIRFRASAALHKAGLAESGDTTGAAYPPPRPMP